MYGKFNPIDKKKERGKKSKLVRCYFNRFLKGNSCKMDCLFFLENLP